jgi:protein-tyrosine phosphatase
VLQVTAGSLLGHFGADAQAAGWRLLEAGAVAIIATDAHDTQRRPPCMAQAAAAIEKRLGYAVARLVCVENPLRVLQGRRCSSRNNTGVAQVV